MYFGTQHSRVYLLANMVGENCANGMSWLIKKRVLEEEGGLSAFAEYLAEDFFIGKALWTKLVCVCFSVCLLLNSPFTSTSHTHTHTTSHTHTHTHILQGDGSLF